MSEPAHPNSSQHPGLSDERVEGAVSNLLIIGVLVSALVVLAGGVLFLIDQGRQPAVDLREFRHEETDGLRGPVHIFRASASLHSLGLIMLGLLLLIATPVARVIFSVVVFALQRDFLYVLFTLIVLAVLLYSLFSGYLSENGAL
jgi:uncharacterized membrane protein